MPSRVIWLKIGVNKRYKGIEAARYFGIGRSGVVSRREYFVEIEFPKTNLHFVL